MSPAPRSGSVDICVSETDVPNERISSLVFPALAAFAVAILAAGRAFGLVGTCVPRWAAA